MTILYRSDEAVSDWVLARIPKVEMWMGQYVPFGIEIDGVLQAGVVFDAYTGTDVNMHVAIDSMKAVTRKTLKAAFTFAFDTLKCQRVTGLVPAKNEKARAFDEHLGFVLEGCKKNAFNDDDELIYGMTRESCRWL